MCTFFVIKSLEYLKNQPVIFGNYFKSNAKLSSLFYLFLSYLILDILYVIATSIKQKKFKKIRFNGTSFSNCYNINSML